MLLKKNAADGSHCYAACCPFQQNSSLSLLHQAGRQPEPFSKLIAWNFFHLPITVTLEIQQTLSGTCKPLNHEEHKKTFAQPEDTPHMNILSPFQQPGEK